MGGGGVIVNDSKIKQEVSGTKSRKVLRIRISDWKPPSLSLHLASVLTVKKEQKMS